MKPRGVVAIVAALSLTACGESELPPHGQVLLYVNTDAPLPAAAGLPTAPQAPLFDRLRVEIFPPGNSTSCEDCTREFPVDHQSLEAGDMSFGVVTSAEGVRVRLRLYRSGGAAINEPRPESTLEAVVELPWVSGDGIEPLHVELLVDSLTAPLGSLENPVAPEPGPGRAGLVGSWWGAEVRGCGEAPSAGEVCVPGGAFWMGDPRLDFTGSPEHDGALERLVVLSPFFIDAREVSVLDFRTSGLAIHRLPGRPSDDPHEAGGSIANCTYTSEPSDTDQHSVNCLSWGQAQAYCDSLGKQLPSEVQLEYLFSGLGRSAYVWGEPLPSCEDAVFERQLGGECDSFGRGVQRSGTGARDWLELEGGRALDLAGNVSEWARDDWQAETDACWGSGIFHDPVCDVQSEPEEASRSYRGGHFRAVSNRLRAAVRGFITNEVYAVAPEIGVRCSRPTQR